MSCKAYLRCQLTPLLKWPLCPSRPHPLRSEDHRRIVEFCGQPLLAKFRAKKCCGGIRGSKSYGSFREPDVRRDSQDTRSGCSCQAGGIGECAELPFRAVLSFQRMKARLNTPVSREEIPVPVELCFGKTTSVIAKTELLWEQLSLPLMGHPLETN